MYGTCNVQFSKGVLVHALKAYVVVEVYAQ
jgi:hypothetical protein